MSFQVQLRRHVNSRPNTAASIRDGVDTDGMAFVTQDLAEGVDIRVASVTPSEIEQIEHLEHPKEIDISQHQRHNDNFSNNMEEIEDLEEPSMTPEPEVDIVLKYPTSREEIENLTYPMTVATDTPKMVEEAQDMETRE